MRTRKIAIACQGGGSHCAFTAGVLARLLELVQCTRDPQGRARLSIAERYEIVSLSGTSGGAVSAYLAWIDLLRLRHQGRPPSLGVRRFWEEMEAQWTDLPPYDLLSNWMLVGLSQLEGTLPLLSPTPNVLTHQVQRHMMAAIRRAAGDLSFLGPQTRPGCVPPGEIKDLAYGPDNFPALLIGAANVDEGEFSPFLATPHRPPLVEQIVASTALPDLFPAISLTHPDVALDAGAGGQRRSHYWDGLFSQNPPIGDLTAFRELDARPDEIWIVRINPARRQRSPYALGDGPPMTAAEIYDRRNELAGNLSLEQEKRFVRKINRMIRGGEIGGPEPGPVGASQARYKTVEMWGLALEGPADVPEDDAHPDGRWRQPLRRLERRFTRSLGHSTKLLRDPCFLRELQQLGREAVDEFLDFRGDRAPQSRDAGPAVLPVA